MENKDVSHFEIYERLLIVEQEVHNLKNETSAMVQAFHAAQGAFIALEWIAKVVRPIIYLGGIFTAVVLWWNHR
jgi:hypothetical protein